MLGTWSSLLLTCTARGPASARARTTAAQRPPSSAREAGVVAVPGTRPRRRRTDADICKCKLTANARGGARTGSGRVADAVRAAFAAGFDARGPVARAVGRDLRHGTRARAQTASGGRCRGCERAGGVGSAKERARPARQQLEFTRRRTLAVNRGRQARAEQAKERDEPRARAH